VNGNGKGEAEPNRRLDNDPWKNLFGHVSRQVLPNLRLGAMVYWGQQEGATASGPWVDNRVWMLGADATLTAGSAELNVQYIRREDDHPTFAIVEPIAVMNGGLAELVLQPPGSRWYATALYNRVQANLPLLNVRLGGAANVTRYETVSAGMGYLWQRNLRVFGEATWDFEAEEVRGTLGLMTAF
jgi:hypothetical protein